MKKVALAIFVVLVLASIGWNLASIAEGVVHLAHTMGAR